MKTIGHTAIALTPQERQIMANIYKSAGLRVPKASMASLKRARKQFQ